MQNLKNFLKTTDKYVNILSEKGIKTPEDFFYYFPKSYEDRSEIKKISQLQEGIKAVVKAKVVEKNIIHTPKGKKLIEFKLEDEEKNIAYANFLNTSYSLRLIKRGDIIIFSGKAKWSYGKWVFWFPEILGNGNDFNEELIGKIVPVYSDFLGIKASWFQKKIAEKINEVDNLFEEFIPEFILKKYNLLDIKTAIKNIHFPENLNLFQKAKYRFNFEQLLIWQLVSNFNFNSLTKKKSSEPDWTIVKNIIKILPFELTMAQKKAIKKIIEDIHSGTIMRRLLQGDVGSGKTIVASIVAYYIIKKIKKQVAFLVPTEVLAKQHLKNIAKLFLPLGLRVELLVGSTKQKEKDRIKQDLKLGNIDIIVGTHAIIQDDVIFNNLGLIIVDEQHKFGVKQRVKLSNQGNPHMLQMTATPIPRSLALSYFGEFENTVIDELPPGRQKIDTKVISEQEYENLFPFLIKKIEQGQQVYIVTPLIEESEKMENLQSAFEEYEKVKILLGNKNINIGLMHGKLKADEKEKVMKDFKDGKTKILVSTTVIEVGVDVPQATIMIIKNAERFGLAALHQLRGRVGRNDLKSYCFLVTKTKTGESYRRLKYMEKYSDGFKLAEIDLQTRGAGTILGTQQSGEMDLPEDALKDIHLLEDTRNLAKFIIENNLLEKYPKLKKLVSRKKKLTSLIG